MISLSSNLTEGFLCELEEITDHCS